MTARTDPRRILLLAVVLAVAAIAGLWVGADTETPSAEAAPPTSLTVGLDMQTSTFTPGLYNVASLPGLEACVDVDTNVGNGIFYLDLFILNVSQLFAFNADLDFTAGRMQIMESGVNKFFGGGIITNLSKNASPALIGPAIVPPDSSGSFFASALDTGGTHSGSGVLARLKAQAFIVPGGHVINFQISTQTSKGVTLTAEPGPQFLGDTTGDNIFDGPFINAQGIIAVDRPDGDGDGASNDCDNCLTAPNADQKDTDADGIGDACDPDIDGDGVLNAPDNCPTVFNPTQDPNACLDDDNDGVFNALDNCPNTPNADQKDTDADGLGDVCDPDIDNDGVLNAPDNCPTVFNPTQNAACTDSDGDGVVDAFDNCPTISNSFQTDGDGDGVGNVCDTCPDDPNNDFDNDGFCTGSAFLIGKLGANDNCPFTANSDQNDTDADGLGNACDNCPAWANASQALPPWSVPAGDDDCDGWSTADEIFIGTNPNLACSTDRWPPDLNSDHAVDVFDLDILKPVLFEAAPGPPYQPRFDLDAAGSAINIFDLDRLKPLLFASCTP